MEMDATRRWSLTRIRVTAVDRLIHSTPEPERARVSGTLDTIRRSDRMFTLLLEGGKAAEGIAEVVVGKQFAEPFGQSVVESGTAAARASRPRRREPAGSGASVWARGSRASLPRHGCRQPRVNRRVPAEE